MTVRNAPQHVCMDLRTDLHLSLCDDRDSELNLIEMPSSSPTSESKVYCCSVVSRILIKSVGGSEVRFVASCE